MKYLLQVVNLTSQQSLLQLADLSCKQKWAIACVFRFYTCQTHLLFGSRWRPDFFSLIRLWEVDYKQKLKHAGLLSPDGHQAPYVAGEVVCVRGFSHVVGRALLIHVERTTFVLCCGVAFFLLRRLMCPLRWPCMFCLFRVFML